MNRLLDNAREYLDRYVWHSVTGAAHIVQQATCCCSRILLGDLVWALAVARMPQSAESGDLTGRARRSPASPWSPVWVVRRGASHDRAHPGRALRSVSTTAAVCVAQLGRRGLPLPPHPLYSTVVQQDETIVLLDDDEDTVDVLAEFLRQEGYTVEGYADVRQGLERLRRPPAPCLAIMDYRLGELQGPDVARAVRFTWPDLPMVLLTSLPRDLIDREALGKLGIHDVLVKPPTIDTLIRAVAAALGNRCRKRRS